MKEIKDKIDLLRNSISKIENRLFFECTCLRNVIIPTNVTSIGHGAFSGCLSLTSLIIPDSVKWIGDDAFSGCHSLTNITIPNSVKIIGGSAFNNCVSLKNITQKHQETIDAQAKLIDEQQAELKDLTKRIEKLERSKK